MTARPRSSDCTKWDSRIEDRRGDRHRAVGGGHARIYGRVDDQLADLVGLQAVAQRALDVHADLVLRAQRDQDRQGDDAARAAIEAGSRPDVAPRAAGDELLEGP